MSPDEQVLLDELRIARVFSEYFERIDANDPVGASAFMTDDVAFEIMIGQRREGRERFARAVGRVLDGYTLTSHHVSNVLTQIDGDEARVQLYVYAFHRLVSTGEPWHLWARVHDQMRRTGEGWRISEHLVLGLDAVPMRHDIPRSWYVEHPGRLSRPSAD